MATLAEVGGAAGLAKLFAWHKRVIEAVARPATPIAQGAILALLGATRAHLARLAEPKGRGAGAALAAIWPNARRPTRSPRTR
jgi:hypothetical protein